MSRAIPALQPLLPPRLALKVPALDSLSGLALVQADGWEDGASEWLVRLSFIGRAGKPPAIGPADIAILLADGISPAPVQVVAAAWVIPGAEMNVRVAVLGELPLGERPGRFVLRIRPGAGLDPDWASASFTLPLREPPRDDGDHPAIDYLTKDYAGFRKAMLDRMSMLAPQWTDRATADWGISLVETLAYVGDYLSYYQDAVGTEAHLTTARQRKSVARHARLLGYGLGQGRASRVWVNVGLGAGEAELPAGTRLVAWPGKGGLLPPRHKARVEDGSLAVFETLFRQRLDARLNALPLVPLKGVAALQAGATHAHLRLPAGLGPDKLVALAPYLLLEGAYDPETEATGRVRRHVVRLKEAEPAAGGGPDEVRVHWDAEDALPFDLPLEAGRAFVRAVARGNVVLADYGISRRATLPPPADAVAPYRPVLAQRHLVWRVGLPDHWGRLSASALCRFDGAALPCIDLLEDQPVPQLPPPLWQAAPDLLRHGPCDRRFVAEAEDDGAVSLRFGDGQYGLRPLPDTAFTARYRTGLPLLANAGSGSINAVLAPDQRFHDAHKAGFTVTNPIAAFGARQPEPTDAGRVAALESLRGGGVCVRAEDYAALAAQEAGIAEAHAHVRDNGGRPLVQVVVRSDTRLPVDDLLVARVQARLQDRALAGRDVLVRSAAPTPILVTLRARALPGHAASTVRANLVRAFSATPLKEGGFGFFHPSQWRLGMPVYASAILARALAVEGVADARVVRLARNYGPAPEPVPDHLTLAADQLPVAAIEGGESGRGAFTIVVDKAGPT